MRFIILLFSFVGLLGQSEAADFAQVFNDSLRNISDAQLADLVLQSYGTQKQWIRLVKFECGAGAPRKISRQIAWDDGSVIVVDDLLTYSTTREGDRLEEIMTIDDGIPQCQWARSPAQIRNPDMVCQWHEIPRPFEICCQREHRECAQLVQKDLMSNRRNQPPPPPPPEVPGTS